ncbi:hypothetical protein JYP51_09580 [Ponticoccus gilvus]|nr:hypothetical protein [Enemella evansiae]
MLISQDHVIRRAREVGAMLPDDQRIALGLTLIRMAEQPASFAAVLQAERLTGNHARLLLKEALRLEEEVPEAPFVHVTVDTTHGSDHDRHRRAAARPARNPGSRGVPPLRAIRDRLIAFERRLEDSLWGDAIACVGAWVTFLVVLIAVGLLA